MSNDCSNSDACEIAALFEEAQLYEALPTDVLSELGWGSAARIVVQAANDTLAQLSTHDLAAFWEEVPVNNDRCTTCIMHRNDLLKTLLQQTPSDASRIEE